MGLFFSSIFNVTTRKQILNLYLFIFLEDPGNRCCAQGTKRVEWQSVNDRNLKFMARYRPWEGIETVSLALGRSTPNVGRR